MKLTPEEILELNKKIDMVSLIEAYGLEFHKENSSRIKLRCPFHEGDNDPSLVIYTHNSPHSWSCFGCHRGSDPLEFIRLYTGKSFARILRDLGVSRSPLSIEDQVGHILSSGRALSEKNRLSAILQSSMVSFSIKTRTFLRKNRSDKDKMATYHRILCRVDDFFESADDRSEIEIKQFFRDVLKEMQNV